LWIYRLSDQILWNFYYRKYINVQNLGTFMLDSQVGISEMALALVAYQIPMLWVTAVVIAGSP
jgi:hypothetical protein